MEKELIGTTPGGTAIYRVDGAEVRNTLDINFALGAHGLVKDYIPPDEIWVENVPDACANMGHEIYEYERMKREKLPYDKAHEEANQFEHQLRQSGTCSVPDLLKGTSAKVTPKEPWQMTQHEWVDGHVKSPGMHREHIRLAISGRKPVPAEVLKDYPDLAKLAKVTPVTPEVTISLDPEKMSKAYTWLKANIRGAGSWGGLRQRVYDYEVKGLSVADASKTAFSQRESPPNNWNVPPEYAVAYFRIQGGATKAEAIKRVEIDYIPSLQRVAIPKAEAEGKCH